MYIWIAADISDSLAFVKEKGMETERCISPSLTVYDLPLHISLKISFNIDDAHYTDAIDDISELLKRQKRFAVSVKQIEKIEDIVWIRYDENEHLNRIHKMLDELMLEKYGVPQHEYDLSFAYHTTLFFDADKEKVRRAYDLISDTELPSSITVSRFVVGLSPDGKWDTYKVYREIESEE